jgi:hypothetical protein
MADAAGDDEDDEDDDADDADDSDDADDDGDLVKDDADLVCLVDITSTWATGDLFKKADSDSSGDTDVDVASGKR